MRIAQGKQAKRICFLSVVPYKPVQSKQARLVFNLPMYHLTKCSDTVSRKLDTEFSKATDDKA